jgi:hypothetical protein
VSSAAAVKVDGGSTSTIPGRIHDNCTPMSVSAALNFLMGSGLLVAGQRWSADALFHNQYMMFFCQSYPH